MIIIYPFLILLAYLLGLHALYLLRNTDEAFVLTLIALTCIAVNRLVASFGFRCCFDRVTIGISFMKYKSYLIFNALFRKVSFIDSLAVRTLTL